MRNVLLLLGVAAAAAALAAGAGANGSAYSPGLAYGWPGVAGDDGVHYVTVGPSKWTVVAAIRRDGRVLRTATLRGFYAVPLVAYNGLTGGLSGDGRTLVLSSYGPLPGTAGRTRFVLLDSRRLRVRRTVVLDGSWSFDAVSPDASTLYLTEHLRAGDDPLYRVRPVDARSGAVHGAIVDRLEGEEEMGGVPVARATSENGRWAHTLYARRGDGPFVHSLDTVRREAYCVDLPLELGYDAQWTLRLRLASGGRLLTVRRARTAVATIDLKTWKVSAARR